MLSFHNANMLTKLALLSMKRLDDYCPFCICLCVPDGCGTGPRAPRCTLVLRRTLIVYVLNVTIILLQIKRPL